MGIRLGRSQRHYCTKVGIAAGLGYLLTQGNLNQYAIYCAFTAALVVGTSVGEDLATSANRVKGTCAGMAAAIVATALFGPNSITVGLAVSLTAAIALAFRWGIQVARTATVEEAQVDMTLRLGLDVLSCALRGPDADSVQDLRQRINAMCSHG